MHTNHANCTCNREIRGARQDPTRTLTLRNRFTAEVKRRYARLKRLVVESVVVNDAFGLLNTRQPGLVLQQAAHRGQFSNIPLDEQVDAFQQWFQENEQRILMEYTYGQQQSEVKESSWMTPFLILAFLTGLRRARSELTKGGWPVQQYPPNTNPTTMLQPLGVKERLDYINKRSFLGLKNITTATDTALRRIIGEGLLEGVHPREVARRITEAIDTIGRRRAMLLARTEMITAHHSAMMSQYHAAGVLGIRLMAEWLTAGDGRVCPVCQTIAQRDNGFGPGIYTLTQVEGMIPVHPDCRCIALPYDITDQEIADEG
jgi:hypothetical protein